MGLYGTYTLATSFVYTRLGALWIIIMPQLAREDL